jgi:hypothetical protein
MPFIDIPNSVFEAAKPARALDMRNLRDNIGAAARGEANAPLGYGWHPYDRTRVGGSESGLLWAFDINGIITPATFETPLFEAGWDYAVLVNRIRMNANLAGQFLAVTPFRVVANAYTTPLNTGGFAANASNSLYLWFEIQAPMEPAPQHFISWSSFQDDAAGLVAGASAGLTSQVFRHAFATPQNERISRLRLTSAGSFTGAGATIRLFRRRNTIGS